MTTRKTAKKKRSKSKSKTRKASVEVITPEIVEDLKADGIRDVPALRARMVELFNLPKYALIALAIDPETTAGDLTILALLKKMRDYGDLSTTLFYFEAAFGGTKLVGGFQGDAPDAPDKSVTVYEIPSNGSESSG